MLGIFNTIVPIGTIVNGTEGTLAAISAGDYRAAGKTGIQTLLIAVATAITLGEGATALAGGKGAGTAAIGQAENAALKNAAKEGAAGVRVGGKPWVSLEPGAKACQSGCEAVAQSIRDAMGGEVKVITSPGRFLGRVRNAIGEFVNPAGDKALGWSSHHVVLKDGMVFDALTGPKGMSASAYKQLWEYSDVLKFGF